MKKTKYFIYCFIFISFLAKAQKPLLQYIKNIGGVGSNIGDPFITIDNLGNIYTTGFFSGTLDFDPGTGTNNLTSIGSEDAFIMKSDSVGNFIWAKNFGGTGTTYSHGLTLDGSGNIYIIGTFSNTTDFDPNGGITNLTSIGGNDAFISKLDGNGNFIWAKSMGGASNDAVKSVAIDASGNVIATGTYSGTADFDPNAGVSNLTSAGGGDIFVLKLDAIGNFLWAKSMGGSSNDFPGCMNIDFSGNIYTTGHFEATVDFDPSASVFNLTSSGAEDIFISKLDANGNFIWAKSIGSTSTDISYGICIDVAGKIYTTGYYSGTVDFDPNAGITNLTSVGGDDVFVLKLDSNGDLIWAKSMGGSGLEYGKTLVLDNISSIYISGLYNGTADFDPNSGTNNIVPNGIFDVFISKLDTSGNFVWVKSFGGTDMEYATAIVLDKHHSIYTAGKFAGKVDFDPNSGVKNITSSGTADAFIHKMIQCNLKSMAGSVSGSSSGNMILYQYIPSLSKWDSVAFTPYSSTYSFGIIDSSSYVLKAVPTATNEQVTYVGNSISWKGANIVNHGCMANTNNTITVSSLTNLGSGPGVLTGVITQTLGYGQKPFGSGFNNNEFKPTAPGQPIGGIIVKGGRNPGGQMFVQTITSNDPNPLVTGTYTLSNLPIGDLFILVDIPGLDTNNTYHIKITATDTLFQNLDFNVDSIQINPINPTDVGVYEINAVESKIKIYPNPASNYLIIEYNLQNSSNVKIELLDIIGKSVKTLLPSTQQSKDTYKTSWLIDEFSSGLYFVKVKINGSENVIKLSITN